MKKTALLILLASLSMVSCKKKGCTDENAVNYSAEAKKDDGSCTYYETPSTYQFTDNDGKSTVSYSGQTDRLNQMEEMTTYMKSGNSSALSGANLKAMFMNTGDNGGGNFSFSSSKQMMDKCFPSDTALFIDWIDSLVIASADHASTASAGQAGTLSSGTSTYLFDANGKEFVQLIEKGLMGAVFMYQATNVYLGTSKMDVDNTTAVDAAAGKYYTKMEHHWDEAFGYFGAPVDFPTNTTDARFWAKYCNKRDAELGCNATMMNAFLAGRTAIVNNDMTTRDQSISTIVSAWERFCAAQAVAYFQGAQNNFGTDDAKFLHELSEAYAFVMCLKYVPVETRVINFSTIDDILSNTIGNNFWAVTNTDLTTAINELNSTYGF
ncbi:MAG: DUF4856 domain-containing protein [Crocinitomicaceae bacterium]